MNELQTTNTAISTAQLLNWAQFVDASPKTIETYTKAIKRFARYTAENGITQPQRSDIIAYRDYLRENYKPATVQGYMAAVKLFFTWTETEGTYPNVARHIKGAKIEEGHKKDYLTTRQAANLLHSVDTGDLKGKRDFAILALMLTTGLRTVSVIRANIGDIATKGESSILYYQGKGRDEKSEYVKLSHEVEAAIREYLKARNERRAEEPLFASISNHNSGGRMTTRSLSRLAKDHLIDSGIDSERVTAHSLRHTAATLNLKNGATIEETQQLLGHRSINTTMIYSHALERENNNSENRISAAIFGFAEA